MLEKQLIRKRHSYWWQRFKLQKERRNTYIVYLIKPMLRFQNKLLSGDDDADDDVMAPI